MPRTADRRARPPAAGGVTLRSAVALVTTLLLPAGCASGGGGADAGPAPPPASLTGVQWAPELGIDLDAMERTRRGVYYEVTVEGTGPLAGVDDRVEIHYSLYRPDGTVVDSTVGRDPFAFTMDRNEVVPGWEEGIRGMRVGGRRILVIPSVLAYGERGLGELVPPGTPLVFDVQLVGARATFR